MLRLARPAIFLALLGSLLAGCKGPVYGPQVKQQVLLALDQHLAHTAYAPGVAFDTWPTVKGRHGKALEEASSPDALMKAVNDALATYKISHLQVMTPERSRAYHQSFSPAALGFDAILHDRAWMVHRVEPESPAARGGLLPADVLVGVPTDKPLAKIFEPLEPGRRVTLVWKRGTTEHRGTFTLARVELKEPVALRWLEGGIAVLRIPSFKEQRYDPGAVAALVATARGAKGLILDLRGNRGGRLAYCGHLLSQVVPKGTLLYRTQMRSGGGEVVRSRPPKAGPYAGPLAVLVSPGNGSGGELVPGVLQELGRAKVLGMKTMGAVLGSRTHPLGHRWEVQLPHLDVLPPQGKTLEGRGVTPDVELPAPRLVRDEEAFAAAREALHR